MRTFVADIIPKIQRFSQKLENLTLLTNQHWVVFNDIETMKIVYIFRSNNQILLSKNGKVEKGTWELVGNNSILIDLEKESYLFKHGFFDENILALKLDGKNEYAFMINENKYHGELNSLPKIIDFLNQKYLKNTPPIEIKNKAGSKNNLGIKNESNPVKIKFKLVKSNKGDLYIDESLQYFEGAKIYSNIEGSIPAPNGKYNVGQLWNIHIKNGIVIKETIF